MHPQTGITILKILQRRVPPESTSIVCTDGSTYAVNSIDWVGRDLGDEFDHLSINEPGDPGWHFLYTSEVAQIVDPIDGRIIFDSQLSDQRMPKVAIQPFGTRRS